MDAAQSFSAGFLGLVAEMPGLVLGLAGAVVAVVILSLLVIRGSAPRAPDSLKPAARGGELEETRLADRSGDTIERVASLPLPAPQRPEDV